MEKTIIFSIIVGEILGVSYILVNLVSFLTTPDTRTIEQIKTDRYRECLLANNAGDAEWCKGFFK